MVEPADIDAARGKALGLVLQRRLQFRRRLVPFGLVIEFDDMAVGVAAAERRALPHVAVDPADLETRSLQRGDAPLQRLRAAGAQRHVLHARRFRRRQLQRIALVIVPAAQIDRLALAAGHGHAHHVDEEFQALVGFWRQQLHVAEMGHVEDRLRRSSRHLLEQAVASHRRIVRRRVKARGISPCCAAYSLIIPSELRTSRQLKAGLRPPFAAFCHSDALPARCPDAYPTIPG